MSDPEKPDVNEPNPPEFRSGLWSGIVAGALYGILSYFFPRLFPHEAAAPSPTPEVELLSNSENPQRTVDRDLDAGRALGNGRLKLGTILAAFAFFCGAAGGVGFVFIFWTGGSNTLLGVTLAISLAGFGCAFVLWSHLLMRRKEAIEPREENQSSLQEQEEAAAEFEVAHGEIQRRSLLKWMITAIGLTFAAMFVSLFRSLGKPPLITLLRPIWKRGQQLVKDDGGAVTVNTLEFGSTVTVYPDDQIGVIDAQTVLIRVPPEFLNLPKGRAGWAPLGYVAYSRVCTHAGCPVGEFESQRNLLLCPCHQSTFAVLNGAQPTGGPATRPLPQLPLYADADGNLRAAGDFTQPPGPGYWDIPQ